MAYEQNSRPRGEGREGGREGGRESGPRKTFFRRKKTCPFSGKDAIAIDWKDPRTLGRFISERGKMMPSRITAVSNSKQRILAVAIKRARYMALMPYVRTEMDHSSREFGSRDRDGGREYGNRDRG